MKKKILSLILSCVMTVGVLSSCGGTYTDDTTNNESSTEGSEENSESEGTDTAEGESVETLNVSAGVALTLNQFVSQASNDGDALYLLNSSLLRYYDGEIENDLAESYEVSEDGLTYTFHLRDGITYSDGTAITAQDFVYSFLTVVGPESTSLDTGYYVVIEGASEYNTGEGPVENVKIAALDDKTFELKLAKADNSFLKAMAMYPVYPQLQSFIEQNGETYGTSPETTLFSGPYTLTEWTMETSMSFAKNDSWWNAANEFPMKTINILDIDSANTEVSMYENGELDIIQSIDPTYKDLIPTEVKTYEGNTEMFLWVKETGNSEESGKVLSNLNFRQALIYALDREAISQAVSAGFVGTNRAVSGNYQTQTGKYVDEYTIDTVATKGDVEKAKEYLQLALDELGYADVSELPEMTYIGFERDDMKLLGEAITDTWKQTLGIDKIQFVQYPIPVAIQNFYTGQYDLFMISLGCTLTPFDIIDSFADGGDFRFFVEGWSTDITDLVNSANEEEFDSPEYYEKVAVAEKALLDESAFVPLYNQTFFYTLQDGIEGYVEPATIFQFQFNYLTYTK